MKTLGKNSSFKKLFKWRSEIAFVAILVIAVLHFAFQFSFIRSENSENSSVAEIPIKIEQISPQTAETKSAEIEAKKKDDAMPPKPVLRVKQRQTKIAPSKPQPKRKDSVETRAARLRRAERILTGV